MRAVMAIAITLALGACTSSVGYGRSAGVATYDELKAAQEACAKRGGTLRLKRNGDAQYLDDYACERN